MTTTPPPHFCISSQLYPLNPENQPPIFVSLNFVLLLFWDSLSFTRGTCGCGTQRLTCDYNTKDKCFSFLQLIEPCSSLGKLVVYEPISHPWLNVNGHSLMQANLAAVSSWIMPCPEDCISWHSPHIHLLFLFVSSSVMSCIGGVT